MTLYISIRIYLKFSHPKQSNFYGQFESSRRQRIKITGVTQWKRNIITVTDCTPLGRPHTTAAQLADTGQLNACW